MCELNEESSKSQFTLLKNDSDEESSAPQSNICDPGMKSRSMVNLSSRESRRALPEMITSEVRSRSFLLGSKGSGFLLGSTELNRLLPNRKISVFVGTWNMNGQVPPNNLDDFILPVFVKHVPDIYVVCCQECCSDQKEWEIRIQESLGPSHVLLESLSLGTLVLCIFIQRDLIWFCSVPEESTVSTRSASVFCTKGAVSVGIMVFGTSLLFVNSHLPAHKEKVEDRISDHKKIVSSLEIPKLLPLSAHKNYPDITDYFDYVFWCGDLNFRLMASRADVIQKLGRSDNFTLDLLCEDQLNQLKEKGLALVIKCCHSLPWRFIIILYIAGVIFRDFSEAPISFPPSYKYDIGTDIFDTSEKKRTPSYTDRIFYKSKKPMEITVIKYDIVMSIRSSDHKPVFGVYEILIKPGKDSIPLGAGIFNRSVFLEGLKRRAMTLEKERKDLVSSRAKSMVCVLQ